MEMLILNHKEYKEETLQRYGQPIEYILNCLENNIDIEGFDLINARTEWESIKNKKPVAYATEEDNGTLKELRLKINDNDDPFTIIKLYRE